MQSIQYGALLPAAAAAANEDEQQQEREEEDEDQVLNFNSDYQFTLVPRYRMDSISVIFTTRSVVLCVYLTPNTHFFQSDSIIAMLIMKARNATHADGIYS